MILQALEQPNVEVSELIAQQKDRYQSCCDIGQTCIGRCQDDIIPRIELNPSFVLSNDNTNYKNDIQ